MCRYQNGRKAQMTGYRSLVVLPAAVAILLAACGATHSQGSRHEAPRLSRKMPTSLAVDLAATPTGWTPVDFGDAQISTPPAWLESINGCPGNAPGTVFFHGPEKIFCQAEPTGLTQVWIYPSTSSAPRGITATLVHGISTYPIDGSPALGGYLVPSMGLQLEAEGPLAGEVLDTLTFSPRTVALGPGPTSYPPSSWHRVTFGGISLAVPAGWPEQGPSNWSSGCDVPDVTLFETEVVLDSGTTEVAASCPAETGTEMVRPGLAGVVIDPGRYGPITSQTTFGACLAIHELTVCPSESDEYDILVEAVHIPRRTGPVAIAIGLAGTGEIARTILQSVRPG